MGEIKSEFASYVYVWESINIEKNDIGIQEFAYDNLIMYMHKKLNKITLHFYDKMTFYCLVYYFILT